MNWSKQHVAQAKKRTNVDGVLEARKRGAGLASSSAAMERRRSKLENRIAPHTYVVIVLVGVVSRQGCRTPAHAGHFPKGMIDGADGFFGR